MKIIKMGNLSVASNICPYCSCEYEYNDADIYTGQNLTLQYAYVICPCCGQINKINTLPPNKIYPPFNPISYGYTYSDISCHIPRIEGQESLTDSLYRYWEPDNKEDK